MSTVKIVPNKKTGSLYQPTTSGKMFRIQVSSVEAGESLDSNGRGTGMNFNREKVGFSYHQTEAQCLALIASAVKGTETIIKDGVPVVVDILRIPGKVIYIDQLEPIVGEGNDYGKLFPYPFSFNGQRISDYIVRGRIQEVSIEQGRCYMQSGKPIFRKKIHTTVMASTDLILSPDNQEDINALIATVLTAHVQDDAKKARFETLKAKGAKRTAPEKLEYAELADIYA